MDTTKTVRNQASIWQEHLQKINPCSNQQGLQKQLDIVRGEVIKYSSTHPVQLIVD